jgi:hypothetical protein
MTRGISYTIIPLCFQAIEVVRFAARNGHETLRLVCLAEFCQGRRLRGPARETGYSQENSARTEEKGEKGPWSDCIRPGG